MGALPTWGKSLCVCSMMPHCSAFHGVPKEMPEGMHEMAFRISPDIPAAFPRAWLRKSKPQYKNLHLNFKSKFSVLAFRVFVGLSYIPDSAVTTLKNNAMFPKATP